MNRLIRSSRRLGRALAALACASIAACSGDGGGGTLPSDYTLQVVSRDPMPGVAGQTLPDSVVVRAVDASGRGVPGVGIRFTVTGGGGDIDPSALTDAGGYARVVWTLGPGGEQTARVRSKGAAEVSVRARLVTVPPRVAPMIGDLGGYMQAVLVNLQLSLPLNPQSTAFFEQKMQMLRAPGAGGDIVEGRRFLEGSFTSRSGQPVALTAIFPAESMRGEAAAAMAYVAETAPLVEQFLSLPYTDDQIQIWYGFTVGSSGGRRALYTEDKGTYDTHTAGRFMPYDAILIHEVCHAFMPNEAANQFLELYGYNLRKTGSPDPRQWTHTRGWVPGAENNTGARALLDIHELIGAERMASAYRALIVQRPPYGQPLTAAQQQIFVDAAPNAVKAQVAAKAAKIGIS